MFTIKNRNKRKGTATITALLSISLLFLGITDVFATSQQDNNSTWMKAGSFAKYSIDPPLVRFPNASILRLKKDTPVIYSWNCVDMNINTAKMEITFEYETENSKVKIENAVYVNAITGKVTFSNGTLIGTSWLWRQPYPVQDEKHILIETPQANLVGYIDGAGNQPMYYDTQIQGFQKAFTVRGNGTIDGKIINFFVLIFDFNTGLLLSGSPTAYEPTFVALGIKNFAISQLYLIDTNIDLGPEEVSFIIREILPYAALISAFILITVGIYFANKKKIHKKDRITVKK